jgi:hypothetical protein
MDAIDRLLSVIGSSQHLKDMLKVIVDLDEDTLSIIDDMVASDDITSHIHMMLSRNKLVALWLSDSAIRDLIMLIFKSKPVFKLIKMYLDEPTITRVMLLNTTSEDQFVIDFKKKYTNVEQQKRTITINNILISPSSILQEADYCVVQCLRHKSDPTPCDNRIEAFEYVESPHMFCRECDDEITFVQNMFDDELEFYFAYDHIIESIHNLFIE